jgi:hypothetical protein
MPLDRVQTERRFRPRYTTGLNPIKHPSDPKFRTGVHTGSNFNPLDRNHSPSPEKVAQADDAIGDPNWQRYGNEYRDIRTHEALPATLTKGKLIWHQLKSGRRRSSRVWNTRTIYCMQPPFALSSPHHTHLDSTICPPRRRNSITKLEVNNKQHTIYISNSLEQLIKYSLFANCIGNEKFTKNNTFANDNTQQQYNIKRQYPNNTKRQNEFSNPYLRRSFPRTSHLAKSIISQDATHLSKPPASTLTPNSKTTEHYRSTAKNRPA